MPTNSRDKDIRLRKNCKIGFTYTPIWHSGFAKVKLVCGFTTLEVLIVIAIIAVIFAVMMVDKAPFQEHMQLKNSALALQQDLRNTQLYAMSKKDAYEYYGVRFFNGLGADLLPAGEVVRQGWKIVRYEPQVLTPPVDFGSVTVVKSSEVADNPELLEKTFFISDRVSIDATSHFQVGALPHSIVFNSRGSATSDGSTLLNPGTEDDIILAGFGHTITLHITPLTGHIEVQDMQ